MRITKLAWEAIESERERRGKNRYRFQSFNVTHNFINFQSLFSENYCFLAFNFDSRFLLKITIIIKLIIRKISKSTFYRREIFSSSRLLFSHIRF